MFPLWKRKNITKGQHLPQATSSKQNDFLLSALRLPGRGVHTVGGASGANVQALWLLHQSGHNSLSPPLLSLSTTHIFTCSHTHPGLHTDWIELWGCVLFHFCFFYLWCWPPDGGYPGKGAPEVRGVPTCAQYGGLSSPPLHCLNDWNLVISRRRNACKTSLVPSRSMIVSCKKRKCC